LLHLAARGHRLRGLTVLGTCEVTYYVMAICDPGGFCEL